MCGWIVSDPEDKAAGEGKAGVTSCDKCGMGQVGYNARERWAALEQIAVIENGPLFLRRCRYCATLWKENLRSLSPVTTAEAQLIFPSAPL